MSKSSDQSTGYFGGLIVGFIVLSLFGIASMVVFNFTGMKRPTDRIFEGDFSAKHTAQRERSLGVVTAQQNASINQAKLKSALANFKGKPEGTSAIPVPGSPTALKALQPKPPAVGKLKAKKKPIAPKEKGKGKARVKGKNAGKAKKPVSQ